MDSTEADTNEIVAYWDRGDCGPNGDDDNWDWCNTYTGKPCIDMINTSKCRGGVATLKVVHGDDHATAYSDNYELDGCQYAYYAVYTCAGTMEYP